ncbi:MAG TPA: PilZ domain-containing protein [Thermoanaerobaculia bacterium]|nr:PilZ domain-containing protein [Thermoanaerobaculia bacterium]
MVEYSNVPRDSRRVPIATSVQFKFDRFSGFISEYSSNISPTGMFIVSDNPEPPGRILDLEFRLGDGFEIIKGQGEVVWARTANEGSGRLPGMGIRFLDLSPGSKELIYRIVDQFVAQGGTPFDLTGVRPAPVIPPAPPSPDSGELPPLAHEPDPFPDLEGAAGTVLPWSPTQKEQKETPMRGGDVLPPLEPLDEIFRLEEAAPAGPVNDPVPPHEPDLDLTQAGPTVVGFDEPIPDPPSYPTAGAPSSPANDLFASYLPQPAAPQDTPQVRPLSTLAGGASVQHQSRRVFVPVLLVVLLAVAVAAFFLRDRIGGWVGLGGGDEEVATAGQRPLPRRPAAPPPPPTLHEEVSLTSDAMASRQEEAPPESQPLPEVVQRKPAPAPAPAPVPAPPAAAAGPAATAIERITFEPSLGGTTVILWGNGALRPESYKRISVESPPREVLQIRGVRRPFTPTRIPVGTSEVKQIRIGYHEAPGGNELHVVLDLAGPRVRIASIEPDGQRLRILLQAR